MPVLPSTRRGVARSFAESAKARFSRTGPFGACQGPHDRRSVRREAVDQPAAAGHGERRHAAAAARVRRIPGLHGRRIIEAEPVLVADHGGAVGPALGPVAAGHVLVGRESAALRVRAGENVVDVVVVEVVVDVV